MSSRKGRAPLRILAVLAFLVSLADRCPAGDLRVEEVAAIDGKIACLAHSDWLVTTVSGPCDAFTPPTRVRLGESFTADGRVFKIGIIIANQADKDMLNYGMDIRKSEWTCVAAETEEDLPSDEERNRTWLYIRKCQPLLPRQ